MQGKAYEPAYKYSYHPAYGCERHGFGKKLPDDIAFSRTDGAAHAYLFCPLGHRDKHDIHDAYPADEQSGCRERKDN